jgi:GNAT superfamily N-acetyltransferase
MAPTSAAALRPDPVRLSDADVEQAMELSREAGWNQRADDWRHFVRHGTVFAVFDGDRLAATAAILPYGAEFGWIGMVLTRATARGRGLGTALLGHCVAALAAEGRTAYLDATPAGEPIYRRLGFVPVAGFTRWQGIGGGGPAVAPAADVAAAIAAANAAFGADRTALLAGFAARMPAACRSTGAGAGIGYAFGRDGDRATQIGPVVAAGDPAADLVAADLVADVVAGLAGPVFLDVADDRPALAARLAGLGFTRQRPFLRMRRGRAMPGLPARTAVIAGPEFG